jgi:hypothetical protein
MGELSEPVEIRGRILISGTGRAGTTFLVQLLTRLGLDTGFDPDRLELLPLARAGFEKAFVADCPPYIVKSPFACDVPEAMFANPAVRIEHVIIPVRRFAAAAASRVHVQEATTGQKDGKPVPGGLWGTRKAGDQEARLRFKFTRLIEILVHLDIPITFMMYPRLVRDPGYLYGKLRFLLGSIDLATFCAAFEAVAMTAWVHRFYDDDC